MSVRVRTAAELCKIRHYYGYQYLINPELHARIYDKLSIKDKYKDPSKLKVLDLYPGPAQHSAVFYNSFHPGQYAMLESRPDFVKYLDSEYANTPLTVYHKDPYEWTSYTDLMEKEKTFVPEKQARDHIHNSFLVIANLTNHTSEALLMQWLACLGNMNWIQKYGLVRMLIWVPTSSAVKLLAGPGHSARSKCSLYREAFCDMNLIAYSDGSHSVQLDPRALDHSSPIQLSNDALWPKNKLSISLLEIAPKYHDFDTDNWDYVTKHLMILRRTPFIDAADSLGHGAKDYFRNVIFDENFLQKSPATMNHDDFLRITKLFKNWAFKPDIYMDFVDIYQDHNTI